MSELIRISRHGIRFSEAIGPQETWRDARFIVRNLPGADLWPFWLLVRSTSRLARDPTGAMAP